VHFLGQIGTILQQKELKWPRRIAWKRPCGWSGAGGKKYTAEEKNSIVLEGLRGESTIAALCRKEEIPLNLYYKWSKEFLEAGKSRLLGDIQRKAGNGEVAAMRSEIKQLKQGVAELTIKNRAWTPALPSRTRKASLKRKGRRAAAACGISVAILWTNGGGRCKGKKLAGKVSILARADDRRHGALAAQHDKALTAGCSRSILRKAAFGFGHIDLSIKSPNRSS
jgi:transposase